MTDVPSITGAGCVLWQQAVEGALVCAVTRVTPMLPPHVHQLLRTEFVLLQGHTCPLNVSLRRCVMYVCVCLSLWTIQYFPVIYPDSGQPGKTFSYGFKVPVEDFELGWGVKGSRGGGA